MLDVSRRSSKRRSSSRASIGSKAARAKILRLSGPQKCGIAAREMERIERELADFRLASRRKSTQAAAEIDERALRLEEVKLSKARVGKVLAKAKEYADKWAEYEKALAAWKPAPPEPPKEEEEDEDSEEEEEEEEEEDGDVAGDEDVGGWGAGRQGSRFSKP